jgi:predicted small metal-binding protein
MKYNLGMDGPFEATGTTNGELMRECIDHAEPQHKMYISVIISIRQSFN